MRLTKSKNSNIFDFLIIGAGVAGCNMAYFLNKYNKNIALIDKFDKVASGASGAAGAFLSPLLGKDNIFKSIVIKSLKFSTKFYLESFNDCIDNCGVLRVPKTKIDKDKFKTYESYCSFDYVKKDDGYFFDIGSLINSKQICNNLTKDIKKILKL